ncbi:MAG: hypothetical protein RQ741_06340 [Wenzhouxiangellaceae bacterium]|nr:hypothetical protein [Wenzhouxiangellaceae bacterium]
MKLTRLVINRLPGIDGRLELAPAADRVSVVIGPNASGKTSLIRALAVLLQRRPDRQPVDIVAEFSDGEQRIKGTAVGQARAWMLDGVAVERPAWPDTGQLAAYLIRGDQLAEAGGTEQQFSDTLRQVMAGGYDLDALAGSTAFQKPGRPRKSAREFEQAGRELQALEARYAELAEQIDQLESLRKQHRASIEAQRRLQAQQRALELLVLEQKLAAMRLAAEQYPEGMDRLDGTEDKRLARLDEQIGQIEQRLERTRQDRAEAEQTLEQSGVGNIQALQAFTADLGEHRQRLQSLEHKQAELRQQRLDLERARATAARHAGQLEPETGGALDDQALEGLERLAERVQARQADVAALTRETSWRCQQPPDPEALADLDAGIGSLRAWLASASATAPLWTTWSLLLASAAAAAGWAWFELNRPMIAAIAAAAGLMPLSHLVVLAARARRAAQHRAGFQASRLDAPARWRRPEVSQRLQQLETRLAEYLRQKSDAERTRERLAELERAQDQLASERRQLEMAADRLQVRSEWALETTGQLRLRAILALREAEGRLERTRGAIGDLEQQADARGAQIRAAFEQASQQPPIEIDSDAIGHLLHRLNPKIMQARSARDAIAGARHRLAELEDERESLKAERRGLFEAAGLVDAANHDSVDDRRERLRDRLRRLSDWQALHDQCRGLEHARRVALEALGGDPDLLEMAQTRDEAGLIRIGQDLAAAAERRDPLGEQIATIENEHKAALEQRELERLNAVRERLRADLEHELEAHRDAEAAQLLIERARGGYRHEHQPALFTRAQALFGRMTRTRFQLTFDGERFGARDQAMAENRNIAELSTATRIQLLLALRLAWIEQAERDGPGLPVFLDEVLATTDPQRYRAVVDALQELVQAGRQVIYLSSQPADAQAWRRFSGERAPQVIELAVIDEAGFGFELAPALPCPDPKLAAEDWAGQAGVAALNPWRGAEAVDLFHLLRDRLDALNALRRFGVITLGQFEHARELALELPIDADLAKALDCRVRAARAWLERWRRGRIEPIDDRVLQASGAVTETFFAEVSALNKSLDGNPAALLEALRERAVSGFRQNKIEELAAHLGASGFLDDRRQATPAELIDSLVHAGLAGEQANTINAWLQASLAASGEQGASDE